MRYEDIKNDRQFKSATGYSKGEFDNLLVDFKNVYEEFFGSLSYQIEIKRSQNKLTTYEDSLLFVLYQLKTNLSFDNLGSTFGMATSNAHSNFTKLLKVLEITLKRKSVFPKREFNSLDEFNETFKDEKELLIDGEENQIQRPKDVDLQQNVYSGKKNSTQIKH